MSSIQQACEPSSVGTVGRAAHLPAQIADSEELHVFVADGAVDALLKCRDVTQRNWSRVANGTVDASGATAQVFIKQFIDVRGKAHRKHFAAELEAIDVANDLFGDLVEVVRPCGVSEDRLVMVYPYRDMVTLDELVRAPSGIDVRASSDALLTLLERILDRLAERQRSNGSVPNFHGIDVRNVGLKKRAGNPTLVEPAYLFDLGSCVTGPYGLSAAKYLVSIALLNWGRPLSRFLRGPDMRLLNKALNQLQAHATQADVLDYLHTEYQLRLDEVRSSSALLRGLKKLALHSVGRRYIARVSNAVQNVYST